MRLKSIVLIGFSIFFASCDDKKALVNFYDKNISKIPCLAYIPKEGELNKKLLELFKFDKNCPYKLDLEYKANIVCNSSYNAAMKTFSNFPTAYIKFEVRDGMRLIYSYYKDLTNKPSFSDLKKGFKKVKKDLLNK